MGKSKDRRLPSRYSDSCRATSSRLFRILAEFFKASLLKVLHEFLSLDLDVQRSQALICDR
jgi:hypothetical protein